MRTEPWTFSATEIVENIRSQKLSAVEVLENCLTRISVTNPTVNALVTVSEEIARKQAKDIGHLVVMTHCGLQIYINGHKNMVHLKMKI